ncbi:MAG: polysaccharide biosynthesis tyrosine autokinase, partial [Cyanobacteria bacterium P01_F01_bin.4]
PGLEKRQRELERQLNAAQSTYETLLENLQQAQVLENQNVGNARVVSPALVPESPIAPSAKLYLLAGGFVGLLLGIMAAFLVDLIDRSVKTVREGQDLYEYPLLGVIPAWKKLARLPSKESDIPAVLVREPQPVPIVEAYQALQANLKFSYLDKPLKTIAITSSVAGEGKSEVVANLALTLAQLGHLVLVVDADMRNPIQHHIWDVPNLQGLSNVVAGQLPLKKAIIRKEPNLHVLPVGVIPPNPLAILESKQISALLRECEKVYDYIIVDTPAILGLADTLTLGRVTDGMLVVMQPGMVDFDSINEARTLLSQSQQKVLGLVANGIKVKSKSDRYFYYNQEYVISQNQENLLGLSSAMSDTANVNGQP